MKPILSYLIGAVITLTAFNLNALDLHCPSDQWLPCGAEIWDLSLYGNAYYIKNGVQHSAGLASVQYNLNQCNTGTIVRTWQVEDSNWNIVSCSQTLYIEGGNFQYNNIHWPESEILVTGCSTSIHPDNLPIGYQRPTWDYVSCSMVASSYDDQVFIFSNDCKKILRKWTVIDWCNYVPGGAKGIYTQTQIIKVSNMTQPLLSCTKNITVTATRCDSSYVKAGTVYVEGVSCTGSFHITNDSPYAINDGQDASGVYPIGTTKFNYIVDYACGQQVYCESEVVVKLKGPTAYCLNAINVALMPVDSDNNGIVDDGMVEVWAKDLDWGSYHECHNQPLRFSFSSDVDDMFRVFTCEHVGFNTLKMWVTDHQGNQSYCLVTINVQNNVANIPDCAPDIGARYVFSGSIVNSAMEPLENVVITAKDYSNVYEYEYEVVETEDYVIVDSFYNQFGTLLYTYNSVITTDTIAVDSTTQYTAHHFYTDTDGFFGSNEIPMNREYELSAYKSDNTSVVDESDLAILSAYLTDRHTFDSPYSFLIADINEDKLITQEDYDILRDLVYGEEDEWPNERQWVFYNMSSMEQMSDEPLNDDIAEKISVGSIVDRISKLDLMGVLKGDLTQFESLNYNEEIDTENRSAESLRVYPNPFSEALYISNPSENAFTITIFSLDGKEVAQYKRDGKSVRIDDMNALMKGSYLYKIENAQETISGKIVKI